LSTKAVEKGSGYAAEGNWRILEDPQADCDFSPVAQGGNGNSDLLQFTPNPGSSPNNEADSPSPSFDPDTDTSKGRSKRWWEYPIGWVLWLLRKIRWILSTN